MSLQPSPIGSVPHQTAHVARAAFPKGTPYLTLRDELGTLFRDEDFADLFPDEGQPAYPPWRLALVTILQFRENLPDRQAAEAVRGRIDWKYLLGLDLTDPGFDFSVLSEFRDRLLAGGAEQRLLDRLLRLFRERGLLKARGRQRTDSTHVLASIRALNRLELLGETLRAALNEVATAAPEWLRGLAPPEWYERYGRRVEDSRLPQSKAKREAYAQTIGQDGLALLEAIEATEAPEGLSNLPSVQTLRRVWRSHFQPMSGGDGSPGEERPLGFSSHLQLKPGRELESISERIISPYDTEARYGDKGTAKWTGYRVHLSETCDAEGPRLLTHTMTTPAPKHDSRCTEEIHRGLLRKRLLPREHMLDSAYLNAEALIESRTQYGVDLVGPMMPNSSWQSRKKDGYGAEAFTVDWESKQVRCPQGKTSAAWGEYENARMGRFVRVRFDTKDCRACPVKVHCTRARWGRQLTFRPREQQQALEAARRRHASEEGKQLYASRAGIEGTISQGVRIFGLRQSRYRGLAKTHLQHVATAAAINLDRFVAWVEGRPLERTRTSHFAALAA